LASRIEVGPIGCRPPPRYDAISRLPQLIGIEEIHHPNDLIPLSIVGWRSP